MRVRCPHCDANFIVTRAASRIGPQVVPCPSCGLACTVGESDDLDADGDDASRRRKATVTEGPGARDALVRTGEAPLLAPVAGAEARDTVLDLPDADELLADDEIDDALEPVAPADLEYEPTPRAGFVPPTAKMDAVDAPSIKLRPDLAARERAGTTSRDLPAVAPPVGFASTPASSPVAEAVKRDTEVVRTPLSAAQPAAPIGLPWVKIAVAAVVVATLGGAAAFVVAKGGDRRAPQGVGAAPSESPSAAGHVATASPAAPAAEPEAEPVAEPAAALEPEPAAASPAIDAQQAPPAAADEAAAGELVDDEAVEREHDHGAGEGDEGEPVETGEAAVAADSEPGARRAAPAATHVVAGTAADREAPYLALRDAPTSSGQLIGQMADDTLLRVLARRGRWWRVEVADGPLRGQIGWAHRRWMRAR